MSATSSGSVPVRWRRIVVGFDGSAAARTALEWAAQEAGFHQTRLDVRTVVESLRLGLHSRSSEVPTLPELRVAVEEITQGTDADFRVSSGDAVEVLCGACEPTDLLVVGSRGRNPLAGLLLGSVSHACLLRAPCSVVVVGSSPPPHRPHRRVIVGIDESEEARAGLLVAAHEARLRAAELVLVHAFAWGQLHEPGLIVPATRQLQSWAEDLAGDVLGDSSADQRVLVVDGNAPEALVRHSAGADLLVLASRRRTALTTLTFGSTGESCARRAKCPVMIVRPVTGESDDLLAR